MLLNIASITKAEEDSNPRFNGNPFQDKQLRAHYYTTNLFQNMIKLTVIHLPTLNLIIKLQGTCLLLFHIFWFRKCDEVCYNFKLQD